MVVTYFDFWWSQRLFSEKAVGKRVVGSGSVTKLAIDQLKPRRSSLSATSVQCKQALHNTLQFTAFLHFPRDRPLHFLCTLSLCTALARQNAMHFSLCISHLILHCAHWTLHFALRWRVRAQADLASPIEDGSNEPLSVGATTPSQPVHYEATSALHGKVYCNLQ